MDIRPGFLDRRKIERVIFFLRSNGCRWARDPDGAGGCAMCGHIAGASRGTTLPAAALASQFRTVFDRIDFLRFPMLCLYNAGSFLNPEELPPDARRDILHCVAGNDDIEHLIIESRPEFFQPEVLGELSSILCGKTVEIGVGLETHDPILRNAILNKGVQNPDLERLKPILQAYDNLRLLCYVLVKPPFLSEGYALQDAIDSVNYAFGIGADVVSLEPVSIQAFTLIDFLARAGHYRTPWIWTVIDIIRNVASPDRLVRIGGFEFFPVPKDFVHNCARCNTVFVKAIDRFNSVNSLDVFTGLDCVCRKNEWVSTTAQCIPPDPQQVLNVVRDTDAREVIRTMIQEHGGPERKE
jgi:radical SAM enzyme (TIGR01210 family)